MPFFISKQDLEDIQSRAHRAGWDKGYREGKRTGQVMASTDTYFGGLAKASTAAVSEKEFRALVRLVPALEKYTESCMLGLPYLDKEKLAADIRDLDAHEAAERGRQIAETLKEEGK